MPAFVIVKKAQLSVGTAVVAAFVVAAVVVVAFAGVAVVD